MQNKDCFEFMTENSHEGFNQPEDPDRIDFEIIPANEQEYLDRLRFYARNRDLR